MNGTRIFEIYATLAVEMVFFVLILKHYYVSPNPPTASLIMLVVSCVIFLRSFRR